MRILANVFKTNHFYMRIFLHPGIGIDFSSTIAACFRRQLKEIMKYL